MVHLYIVCWDGLGLKLVLPVHCVDNSILSRLKSLKAIDQLVSLLSNQPEEVYRQNYDSDSVNV